MTLKARSHEERMSSKRTGSVPETSKQRDHPSQETLKEIQFQVWTLLSIFILFLRFFFHDKKMTLEDKKEERHRQAHAVKED